MGEVKGCFGTPKEASTFAQKYVSTNPSGGPFTITSGQFPTPLLPKPISVAGEGNAYFLPGNLFPSGPVTVIPYAPVP